MSKKIKAVILCGGQGSRIKDVSEVLPKPMLPIGRLPMLWHIMKLYSHFGINDFVLCLGYKGWVIKEFFLNYHAKVGDISVSLGKQNAVTYHDGNDESKWNITMAETGEEAQTGTRVVRIRKYLQDCDLFMLTYGDGVADIDISKLIAAHTQSGLLATITGVHPVGRFGEIDLKDNVISAFNEKPNVTSGLINGGFMVFDRRVLDKYFRTEKDVNLEKDIIPQIVRDKQVGIYKHEDFWQCMDTPREYQFLNQLWHERKAPWKIWQ